MTHGVENQFMAWDRHKNMAGLNQLIGPNLLYFQFYKQVYYAFISIHVHVTN